MDFLKGYEPCSKNLRFKNADELSRKLSKIRGDSTDSLQVISDFDYTFSKYHDGSGERLESSWGVIESSPVFPKDFKTKCKDLFSKYHPYEVDPSLSIEEKTPHIAEWYTKLIDLMRVYITDVELVHKAVGGFSNVQLRDGLEDFVSQLYKSHVPLLIFSAGFGSLIKELMVSQGLFNSSYTKIHSNFLEFDESSKKVIGVKEPVVHVFNKNGGSYLDSLSPEEREDAKKRKNVVLLGDSLGDLTMSNGLFDENAQESSTIIKVGFLNHDIESYLDRYLNEYDVVIIDDQTMNFPLHLLKLIA